MRLKFCPAALARAGALPARNCRVHSDTEAYRKLTSLQDNKPRFVHIFEGVDMRELDATTLSRTTLTSAWTGPRCCATRCIQAWTFGKGCSSASMVGPCSISAGQQWPGNCFISQSAVTCRLVPALQEQPAIHCSPDTPDTNTSQVHRPTFLAPARSFSISSSAQT